jgi:hypothetical protein
VKEINEHGRTVERPIEQITSEDGTGLCSSIKIMMRKYPFLVELEDLYVLGHRIGMLKGFLECKNEEGFLKAEISGLTNTLRFQHRKPLANIPQTPKKYWQKVRGVLIAPEGYELCGADMTSLEDRTKQHYMYFFDKAYVKEMQTEDYDPHLDIAILAGYITKEQAALHKLWDKSKGKEGVSCKDIRLKAKKVNYACIYGAKPPKIAQTANVPLSEAKVFHGVYWYRNKAVLEVAASCKIKEVNGMKWLYNPISKFWLSLRHEKDKFSTLNQSTGVFCFDRWVGNIRSAGIKLCGQFHDEVVFHIREEDRAFVTDILHAAIDSANKELNLNVNLAVSVAFGDSYAEIH